GTHDRHSFPTRRSSDLRPSSAPEVMHRELPCPLVPFRRSAAIERLAIDDDCVAPKIAQVATTHHRKLLFEERTVDLLACRQFTFGRTVRTDHDHLDATLGANGF